MAAFTKFLDVLEWLIDRISAVLIMVLIAMLFVQVVNRYVLGISWPFLQFLLPFSFVWLCLLGSAVAVRKRMHFAVDMVSPRLGSQGRQWYAAIISSSVLAAGLVLVVTGVRFTDLGLLKKDPATGTSMVWIYSAIAVGGALICVFAIEHIVRDFRSALAAHGETQP